MQWTAVSVINNHWPPASHKYLNTISTIPTDLQNTQSTALVLITKHNNEKLI